MAFPSVCYEYVLLPLVNKEAAFGECLIEDSQARRDIYIERESVESERCHVASTGDRGAENLLVNHEPHDKIKNNRNVFI